MTFQMPVGRVNEDGCGKRGGVLALEDPGGFVDEHGAEALGVVGLEALDHELHGVVVLVVVSNELVRRQGGATTYHVS